LALAFAAPVAQAYDTFNLDGSINIGQTNQFSALAYGDLTSYDNNITGPSVVTGNVGIGGHGNFSMSDGLINGDIYMNNYGTFSISGPAQITGHRRGRPANWTTTGFDGTDQTSTLNGALADAVSLSNAAAGLSSTSNYSVTLGTFNGNTVNTGNSITIKDSNPFGGSHVVLNLQDFVMTGGTFTLQGTAATSYVINVSRNFSLNNSSIVLSGGLLASHVLFNVKGTGGQVSLNQGTSMQGVLLAWQRKIDLSGGKVYGKAIGNQVVITSGGQVVSQ
jgi:hypothetical protein